MKVEIESAISVLAVTPQTVRAMLISLPDQWTRGGDRSEAWTPFDIVGHLIHGEETDWVPRAQIILAQGDNVTFEPFDRFAQFERSKGKSLADLIDEFQRLRTQNVQTLRSWNLS